MLLDLDAVDDVSQEVLISIMGSIRQYRGVGKFSTWVHPIAKRRVADHLRRQRDATALEETDLPAQRFSSMVASRTALRAALAELPEKYQAPLILRDLEQLPVAEIARASRPARGHGESADQSRPSEAGGRSLGAIE